MIKAFRIVQKKWAGSAFDGEGARLYGGRWNNKGIPCVYLAGSESLAILEILVHLDKSSVLEHYTIFEFEFDKSDLLVLENKDLPINWQEDPAPDETASLGDDWLNSASSLALKVPSTIVPREFNYLVNVRHKAFSAALSSVRELSLELDPRLRK